VRIIFRLAEFSGGVSLSNPVLLSEDYTFCLDGLPMLLALMLLNSMHPGMVLKGQESEFPKLTRKQRKDLKQIKKDAKKARKEEKRQKGGGKSAPTHFVNEVAPDTEGYELSSPALANDLLSRFGNAC
jgi:hypothetical protein